jgi:hypothetical protein
VDLEDALAWGGFDAIGVTKRRGRFGAAEAGRILREIVDNMCGETHAWLRIDARPDALVVRQLAEVDRVPPGPRLTELVLRILEMRTGCPRGPAAELVLVLGRRARVLLGLGLSHCDGRPGPRRAVQRHPGR